eukprot:1006182_1
MGAECYKATTTCELDATGCSGLDLNQNYQLDTYETDKCSDGYLVSYSWYTCVGCDPFSSDDTTTTHFSDENIHETKIISKQCSKSYSVNENRDNDLCNTLKTNDDIGFDLVIEPVIGAKLYEIVNVYARIPILNKLRMQPIQTSPSICGFSSSTSMCAFDSDTIYASFRLTTSWSLYFGAVISVENAVSQATNALLNNTNTQYTQYNPSAIVDPSHEVHVFGPYNLISSYRLGCVSMIGLSAPLNSDLLNSQPPQLPQQPLLPLQLSQ